MKAILAGLMLASVVIGCGPRQVEVNSAPAATSDVAVNVTNNLSEPVNVWVNSGGQDVLLGQVAAGSAQSLPVRGVAAGSTVTLKATRMSDRYTYTKNNVTLSGTYLWQVP